MSSMSYCLFENTLGELGACVNRMAEAATLQDLIDDMSKYERAAYGEMWRVCRDFLAEHERLMNTPLEEDIEEVME